MRMIAALAAAMVLTLNAATAEPVFLSCTGTAERKIFLPASFPKTITIAVDTADSTLMLGDDRLPLASVAGNIVTVDSPGLLGERVWIFLNQTTGGMFVATFNGQGQVAWEFEAVCKPAESGEGGNG
jgi:hypothetical protein